MTSKSQTIEVRSVAFTVTMELPKFVERGHTARFRATFEHVKDGLIDPSGLMVKFFDSGDTQLGTNQTPTKESKGIYYLDFNIAPSTSLGPYVVEWSGAHSSLNILARAPFFVKRTVR